MRTAPGLILALLLTDACGGPSPPAGPVKADAAAESPREPNPADLAEPDAGADASLAMPAAPAPAPEVKDDCTPVGVDFEKRARPRLKECYAVGKKKEPNLQGTVRIAVEIDTFGKIKGTKITEKTLPDAVAQCMLKVVKATALPEASKCPGKTLTIPMTFPTPP